MAKASKSTIIKRPSVLAFTRKIEPSEGFMFATSWHERGDADKATPIVMSEKTVRGTISNELKAKDVSDPLKMNHNITAANIQTVDVATLPHGTDTLKLSFAVDVLPSYATPSVCNSTEFAGALKAALAESDAELGMFTLAERYAYNIASGRFLWRNRAGASEIEISVRCDAIEDGAELLFDAYDFPLNSFNAPDLKEFDLLVAAIEKALKGTEERDGIKLHVDAFVRHHAGKEVYPSQEFAKDKGDKSRVLYSIDSIAGMHAQKLGNAIRTIDDWHPEAAEHGAISVEVYGSVTSKGIATRAGATKKDFYTLFDKFVGGEELDVPDRRFIVAMLIRGGVFGGSDK